MIRLPFGVDINNLIDDIRIFSWQAADILLYYSKLLEDSNHKVKILKNKITTPAYIIFVFPNLLIKSPENKDGKNIPIT